ncbi:MAG TPA: TAXI family TRAP transporter solute-binding subunit [Dongiaceae bacterium]|nr:TAXI family TRAP transporter solute-binding subunit [Dongiaceae bacterium]
MLPRQALNLVAATMAIAIGGCMAVSVTPAPVTLATGSPGGIFHPVGNAICRMFNLPSQHQASPCVALSSEGAVENILRIESGKSSFGLSQTDVAYAAFHGEGPFAPYKIGPLTFGGADPKLRMLIALYPDEFTVLARADSGIRDFEDLRGKRIGIGTSGAGYTFTRDVVLKYYDWTISDAERLLELGSAEQNQALCSDKVDAIIFVDGHPSGLTQEATTACAAKLVRVAGSRIDQLLAAYPYYEVSVIPGGIYAGNPDDVPTIGTRAILVTSSDIPDDLAYALVKAVFENFADFRRLHPALAKLNLKAMVPSSAVIPIHPGALKYFREAGLLP